MPNPNEPLREKLVKLYNESRQMAMLRMGSPIDHMVDEALQLIADDKRAEKAQIDLKGQWKVWNLLRSGNDGFVNEAGNVELTPEHIDLMLNGLNKLLKEEVKEL